MKIELITTPGCPNCAKVKKMFDEMKLKYEVIDVVKKPAILKKYPISSAPGIVINGRIEFTGVPDMNALKKRIR